ncbi:unnamed protein product [Paramecium octaurelia]|uniref:Translation elongation factor EFG/EF2 domain-containing protein n=1 Tax=Paramecium octaurelia TaxID=43137 RepID=A0A8S1Y9L2_PAROT|nr:unnamed protein product [Paramecium octaurelia]
MAKSANQHNRLCAQATSLNENLQITIEKGLTTNNSKSGANILAQEYDWNKDKALKIWTFGPDDIGQKNLCDQTTAVQHINEIRESVSFAWQQFNQEGALCQENLRGVGVNILDCVLIAETIHRGEGQIIPTALRLHSATQTIRTNLLTEVTVPKQVTAGVYSCLSIRQGIIIEEEQIVGSPLKRIHQWFNHLFMLLIQNPQHQAKHFRKVNLIIGLSQVKSLDSKPMKQYSVFVKGKDQDLYQRSIIQFNKIAIQQLIHKIITQHSKLNLCFLNPKLLFHQVCFYTQDCSYLLIRKSGHQKYLFVEQYSKLCSFILNYFKLKVKLQKAIYYYYYKSAAFELINNQISTCIFYLNQPHSQIFTRRFLFDMQEKRKYIPSLINLTILVVLILVIN